MQPLHPDRPIQIRLLGEFDVSVAHVSRRRAIHYLKPKLLLAMLALAQGKPYARAELAHVLWPDDLKDGRVNLRHALFVLRRLLDPVPDAWLTTGKTLALNPEVVTVDALALMAMPGYASLSLAQRLSYDRGRLLEYADLPESAAFTIWKTNWQSRIERDVVQCRNALLADLQATGNQREALDTAKQWVDKRPEDENAHRQLIQLLLASNDHEAASLAYQHCAHIMRQCFDSEPSAHTRALIEQGASIEPADEATRSADSHNCPLGVLAIVLSLDDDDPYPDGLMRLLRTTLKRLETLARREGGHVLVGADDSLVIVYGYPQISERPALSAAKLGRAMQALALPEAIRLGMGVHACIVPGQSGCRPQASSFVCQHAMRLAYLAGAHEMLVSTTASIRLADQYTFRQETRHGQALQILESVRNTKSVGRMFGRVQEFDSLVRLWARLPAAQCATAVVVRADVGLGKSLLSRVMGEYVRHTGGNVRMLCADETHRATPLYPVLEHVMQKLGLHWEDHQDSCNPVDFQAQLVDTIAQRLALDTSVSARLHHVLFPGGPYDDDRPDTHNAAHQALQAALIGFLLHRAEPGRPLLLVWDDIHWADSCSVKLLESLLSAPQSAPTMVLLTARTEFACTWRAHELTLKPLGRQAVAELVAHRLKGERISAKLRARLVDESGGIPLYVQEMLRQVTMGGDIGVTPLITDLMAIRLSHLSARARKAAQFSAVAGHVDVALMTLASRKIGWDAEELPVIMRELRQQRLIDNQLPAGFSHPLVRDAIYHTLTHGQQRSYHAQIAQCLIERAEPAESACITQHLQLAQHAGIATALSDDPIIA